jgi:transglutaminase-like putative cysteine protease
MRFTIRHTTNYTYEFPANGAVQRLRLTPPRTKSQTIHSWAIETDGIDKAAHYVDGFGNLVHLVTHAGPYETLTISAGGEVETTDTGGVIGDIGEVANPQVFLRETDLTQASDAITAMAMALPAGKLLSRLHHLLEAIATRVHYVTDSTDAATSAAEAFEAGRGVCQDHAHIFIVAARGMGLPSRYVTGYLHVAEEREEVAHHAWAETHVPGLGWVGFDPANNVCPTERYVRLACGFDAKSAAPIVGMGRGGGRESLKVAVVVQEQQQQQQQ